MKELQDLSAWGFGPHFEEQLHSNEAMRIGRVIEEQKNAYRVHMPSGPVWARLAGRLNHTAEGREALPTVGDFVVLGEAASGQEGWRLVERVLTRHSALARKAVGRATDAQLIAANVDTVLIATSMNQDWSERRLERYLTMVWAGGAVPVVLLTKSDLCEDVAAAVRRAQAVALGCEVLAVNALATDDAVSGVGALASYLAPGKTIALVGSSGVGKSTLINRLAGEAMQAVREIRSGDDKGRHTTTFRSLLRLPSGALLVDTPGIRELMPWDDGGDGGDETFADILAVAAGCRFGDCSHDTEPDCAVKTAIEDGDIDAGRFAAFLKRRREQAYLERKVNARAAALEKDKWKKIHKELRRHPKKSR